MILDVQENEYLRIIRYKNIYSEEGIKKVEYQIPKEYPSGNQNWFRVKSEQVAIEILMNKINNSEYDYNCQIGDIMETTKNSINSLKNEIFQVYPFVIVVNDSMYDLIRNLLYESNLLPHWGHICSNSSINKNKILVTYQSRNTLNGPFYYLKTTNENFLYILDQKENMYGDWRNHSRTIKLE